MLKMGCKFCSNISVNSNGLCDECGQYVRSKSAYEKSDRLHRARYEISKVTEGDYEATYDLRPALDAIDKALKRLKSKW